MTTAAVAPSTTRRVLGDMSVNTPIAGNTPMKNAKGLGLEGVNLGATMNKHAQTTEKRVVEIELEEKRDGSVGDSHVESPSKRRKIDTSSSRDGAVLSPRKVQGSKSPSPTSDVSASVSPSSSFGNTALEMLDDSQNTVITIPDNEERGLYGSFTAAPPVVQAAPLTGAQMRAKARSIRLRLTLASYKVRTNQIDVPISRLEIRSSTTTPSLPQLRRATSTTSQSYRGGPRTALPSAPTSSSSAPHSTSFSAPNSSSFTAPTSSFPAHSATTSSSMNRFQDMAQKVVQRQQEMESLTPNSSRGGSPVKGAVSTPVLPRQRAGLGNAPTLLGEGEEGDVPSSVVKGRAADGLLSLMQVRE